MQKKLMWIFLQKWLPGRVLLLTSLLLSTLLFTLVSNIQTTEAATIPGGNVSDPVVRAVDIAEPAVVRILTNTSGHLIVQFPTGNVSFPQQGGGYQATLSGSGTFITAHGDILTADHVVNPPAQDPGTMQYFANLAAQDVTQYANQHNTLGAQVTQSQVEQELVSGQLPSTLHFDTKSSTVFLSTSYSGPLTATSLQNVPTGLTAPVDKIEKESPFNQEDVAIVHVPLNDTPSVPLGDSSNVQQQDNLTIIGFPGNGDVSQQPTDFLTASVNKINVSSIKTTDSGAQVIQVGGNVEHGDSGGPALDDSGTVVGIVSFGLADANSGGSTSFLQASNSANTLIKSLGLNTTPGTFEKNWTQAFNDYTATTAGHWHKAANDFQQLAFAYPLFQAVTPYLHYAQTQAASEKATTSTTPTTHTTQPASGFVFNTRSLTAIALTIGVLLLLLLLVVVLIRVAWHRGKRPATKAGLSPRNAGTVQTPPSLISPTADSLLDGMSAFGAPARTPTTPSPTGGTPGTSSTSTVLRAWPCGHMNRPNARFCSVCGEPAPAPPPIRHTEQ